MNFRVIDGDRDYLELLPEFVRLYNTPEIRIKELRRLLGIGQNTYFKLLKECREQGLITLRRKPYKKQSYRTNPKYWSRTITRGCEYYSVRKRINGKNVYFCQFKKAKQAQLMVEKLKAVDWDITQTERLKAEVLREI